LSPRELRDYEKTSKWFTPRRKKPSVYEDVTMDVAEHVDRHMKFGYQIAFSDGRPHYWDSSAVKSTSWWDYRDPGEVWGRPFFQVAALHEREISNAKAVARSNNSYAKLDPAWTAFLNDHLQAIALMEYGLVMPMANAVRPSLGDAQLNCISFNGGYKLRHSQALALYGMELDSVLEDFGPEQGKANFLTDEAWQPARRYLERLDLVHDWVEIVVAANIIFEPLCGVLMRRELLQFAAVDYADVVTPIYAQGAQAEWTWSRQWSTAFVEHLVTDENHGTDNRAVIDGWIEDWGAMGEEALVALSGLFDRLPRQDAAAARDSARQEYADVLRESALETIGVEASRDV
jgi:hypothetical protein